MTRRLIGFAGKKRAGKDTAGAVLVSAGFQRISFAQPLKEMLADLLYLRGADIADIHEMIEGSLKEAPSEFLSGRSPRHAMQTLGTEWGREQMGINFWTDTFRDGYNASTDDVVVTDVRFPNEVEAIHALGGRVYYIERDGLQVHDPHKSEVSIDPTICDEVIRNNYKTIEEFQNLIRYVFLGEQRG